MAIAYRNSNNNIILRIESSHNKQEINYDIAFQSDANYKKWIINRLYQIKTILLKIEIIYTDKIIIVMIVKNLEPNKITSIIVVSNTVE